MSVSQLSTSTQRKIKVRPALIADDDDDDGVEIVKSPPKKEKSKPIADDIDEMGSREHLKTKQQIEDLRKEYGDEWLHSKGATKVQGVMGIQTPLKISTTQTTEQKLENLFGLESTSINNRDRTSTPIQEMRHADFGHSPIDVSILSNHLKLNTCLNCFGFFSVQISNFNRQFHRRATSRVSRTVIKVRKHCRVQMTQV